MRILDKIVFNRLIAILTTFVLGILKIITMNLPKTDDNEPIPPLDPTPKKRKKIFPLRKKKDEK